MGLAPAHALAQEDGADLTAFDRDADLFGSLSQCVEAPLRRCLFVTCHHRPIPLRHQPPRRLLARQRNELAVIGCAQSAWTSGLGSIS